MRLYWLCVLAILLPLVLGLDEDYEDRRLHKKKKRRPFLQNNPCRYRRDSDYASSDRSLIGTLGGAAVGYHLGNKHGYQQQPVINNIINTGGGTPCGGGVQAGPLYGGGGGYGGGYGGGLFNSPYAAAPYANGFSGINWDRTIRQFNRQVIRPITRLF